MARASARKSKAELSPPPIEEDEPMVDEEEEAEDESGSEDESDEEEVVPFLATREKRANAGNRMKALLEEEFVGEDEFKEEADDVEFEAKDEADIFDSDFGSTDSGGDEDEDDDEAGERQLQREARQAKRDARGKKAKKTHTPFIPSFARHTKKQDRVASTSAATLDGEVNAETGSPIKKKRRRLYVDYAPARESSRTAAVAFKESVQERAQKTEERRATTKLPTKKAVRELTQADLIHEALETEEVNRASLLAFYAAEEDRRRAERIASQRFHITGPRITFLSTTEGVPRRKHAADGKGKGKQLDGQAEGEPMESGRRRLIEVIGEAGALTKPVEVEGLASKSSATEAPTEPAPVEAGRGEEMAVVGNAGEMEVDALASTASLPAAVAAESVQLPPTSSTIADVAEGGSHHAVGLVGQATSAPTVINDSLTVRSDPTLIARANVGAHARNYLILEDFEGTRTEEMQAYFGHHWPPLRSQPPPRARAVERRSASTCVITGAPARYRDPATGLAYASLAAYKTLQRVRANEFAFAAGVGAYTALNGPAGLQGEAEQAQTAAGRKPPPRATPANLYKVLECLAPLPPLPALAL